MDNDRSMRGEAGRYAGPAPLVLAAAAFVPLVAWGIYLWLLRWLAPALCGPSVSVWLYFLTALALAAALAGGAIAWQGYRRTTSDPEGGGREMVSARCFGVVGVIAAAVFGIGIVIQTLVFRAACLG